MSRDFGPLFSSLFPSFAVGIVRTLHSFLYQRVSNNSFVLYSDIGVFFLDTARSLGSHIATAMCTYACKWRSWRKLAESLNQRAAYRSQNSKPSECICKHEMVKKYRASDLYFDCSRTKNGRLYDRIYLIVIELVRNRHIR